MIIGIGCDMVEHSITDKLRWHIDSGIQSRIFSLNELDLLPEEPTLRIPFLAGRFAIKEAVLKCLGTGMVDGLSMKEIETLNDRTKKPFIQVNGNVQQVAFEMGITRWHASITHTSLYTTAFVLAEG